MKKELQVSVTEAVVAVVAIVAATITTVTNHLSSEALVLVYGSVLGYVFGRARNGIENNTLRANQSKSVLPSEKPVLKKG